MYIFSKLNNSKIVHFFCFSILPSPQKMEIKPHSCMNVGMLMLINWNSVRRMQLQALWSDSHVKALCSSANLESFLLQTLLESYLNMLRLPFFILNFGFGVYYNALCKRMFSFSIWIYFSHLPLKYQNIQQLTKGLCKIEFCIFFMSSSALFGCFSGFYSWIL